MPPDTNNDNNNQNQKREQTLRLVINGLANKPAYLVMFGIGLLASALVGFGIFSTIPGVAMLSMGAWFIYCVIALAVIFKIEQGKAKNDDIVDDNAKDAFDKGGNGDFLSGLWHGSIISEGHEEKFTMTFLVSGSKVFGTVCNDQSGEVFWSYGRLSDRNRLAMIYWGPEEIGKAGLTGVSFLSLKDGENHLTMTGEWNVLTSNNTEAKGNIIIIKVGYIQKPQGKYKNHNHKT